MSILIHQFLVQYIEIFKFSRFFDVFLNVLATSAISFIFIFIYALAFKIKQKVWNRENVYQKTKNAFFNIIAEYVF